MGCRGARITASSDREFTTIKITGDIDACNVDDLTNLARNTVPESAALILDLAGVDFIAVAGLRALLAVNIECARCGSSWALIVGPAVVPGCFGSATATTPCRWWARRSRRCCKSAALGASTDTCSP